MKTVYIQRTVEYLLSIQHPIPPNGEVRETENGVKYYILEDKTTGGYDPIEQK